MKACIATFFMGNISRKTVELQRAVIEKYNKSKHHLYQMNINVPHAVGIDYFWTVNGQRVDKTFKPEVKIDKQIDYDVVLFLDIDAIPLHEDAIDYYITEAAKGRIIGNVQRSNHIDNGKHVFAAPSAMAISVDTFLKLGKPSAVETYRADVAEEYTFAAEESGIPVDLIMPARYDAVPFRYDWEGNDKPPYWELGDNMPKYGVGTTFGVSGKELFYHNFQIIVDGEQQRFWKKCEDVLVGGVYEDRSIKH